MSATRRALPLLISGIIALGTLGTGCGESGIEVIDRSIDLPGTVLYATDRDGSWNIYMSNFNSTQYLSLTGSIPGPQKEPCWDPDGEAIYFATEVSNQWHIATITDVDNAGATYAVLTDTTGQQTYPVVNGDGTRLVFLNMLPTGEVPDLWIMDLTTGAYTYLTSGLNIHDMEFVPGSSDLVVLDGNHLKVVDTTTGNVNQYIFDSEVAAAFRHASFSFGTGTEIWCSGLELNRDVYTLGLFDYNGVAEIERVTDGGDETLTNFWKDISCFQIEGEDYLLVTSSTGFTNRVGVVKVDLEQYMTLYMRQMQGDNRWPDWTAVEHF